MPSLFSILVPLYGVIALGWLAGRLGVMGHNAPQVLSRFVFLFAMPLAVFGFFAEAPPPAGAVLPMMAAYALGAIAMMLASGLVARAVLGLNVNETGAHAFLSTCGNAVFLGLPIALTIPGWGQPFLMLMLLEGTLVYGSAVALFQWSGASWTEEGENPGIPALVFSAFLRTIRTPIVIAIVLGLACSLLRVTLPVPVTELTGFFGAAAAPSGLFVLGLYMASLPRAELSGYADTVMMAGIAKLAVFPALTFVLCGLLTGWNWALVAPATFFTSLPPAVSAVVQASHFGIYERRSAAGLIILTPVGLVLLPILLAILPHG